MQSKRFDMPYISTNVVRSVKSDWMILQAPHTGFDQFSVHSVAGKCFLHES